MKSLKKSEIKEVESMLKKKDLRESEKHNLKIYLKSLKKEVRKR